MRGDLVPGDTYPVLHMYLAALLLRAGALVDPHGPAGHPSWPQLVVIVRVLNALLGTATVALLALLARRLFGWRVGLLAAALLALSPVSIVHAHYEMGDVPQAFFVVAALARRRRRSLGGRTRGVPGDGRPGGSGRFRQVLRRGRDRDGPRGGARRPAPRAGPGRRAPRRGGPRGARGLRPQHAAPPPRARPLAGPDPGVAGAVPRAAAAAAPAPLARGPHGRGARADLVRGADVPGGAGRRRRPRPARLGGGPRPGDPRDRARDLPVVPVGRARRPLPRDPRPLRGARAAVAVLALSRWSRRAALAAALALLAVAAVDALHVAYLFWTDDTREHALRWRRRHVPPEVELAGLRDWALDDPRSRGRPLLATDTQSDDRHHVWYSVRKTEPIARALARLEREGKLLRRFELLPRGFIAPTISLYDLESMPVPYAFPPPDAAASDEAVVFVDPDLVPDRAAVVVMPGHPRTWTLVSRTPLPQITLGLTGAGRLRVRWGLRGRGWAVDPRRPVIVELAPWREFPWFKPVYRVRLETAEGRVAVRLLRTPCEVAEQRLVREDWAGGHHPSGGVPRHALDGARAAARPRLGPGAGRAARRGPRGPRRPRAGGARPLRGARRARRPSRTGRRGARATRPSSAAAASPGTARPSTARPRRLPRGSASSRRTRRRAGAGSCASPPA